MSSLDALAEAMRMLQSGPEASTLAAGPAAAVASPVADVIGSDQAVHPIPGQQRAAQEAIGAHQAAENARRARTGAELIEQRAHGRLWAERALPHQWDAVRFGFAARRFLLGDGMGLGKTLSAIGWLDAVDARRVVIVCQAEIASQFADEVRTWAPHRTVTMLAKLTPAKRVPLRNRAVQAPGVIVVNFELFRRDQATLQALIDWQPDAVIVDEAHNLKSTRSANYRYVDELVLADNTCAQCGAVIHGLRDDKRRSIPCARCGWGVGQGPVPLLPIERVLQTKSVKNLCLTTGTPILNSPEDLYPLLHLIDPVRFLTKKAFTEAFCVTNWVLGGRLEFLAHGLTQLKPMIAGSYLARTRDDAGIVLPPQHIEVVPVEINPATHPAQARVVRQIAEQAKITLESGDTHTIMHAMSWLTRKRQSVVWPAGIEIRDTDKNSPTYDQIIFRVSDDVQESAKFDVISENVARCHARGARQIIFSQFKTALVALEGRLSAEGYRVARFDGDTSAAARQVIKDDFYRPVGTPQFDVVLVHYRSGGTGLNLQAATVTHILDEEWGPGRRDQAYARTHRMGQTSPTEVYVYRSKGKAAQVDTFMANLLRLKERMIEQFDTATDNDKSELLTSLQQIIAEDAA